jgi:hypothetical protein
MNNHLYLQLGNTAAVKILIFLKASSPASPPLIKRLMWSLQDHAVHPCSLDIARVVMLAATARLEVFQVDRRSWTAVALNSLASHLPTMHQDHQDPFVKGHLHTFRHLIFTSNHSFVALTLGLGQIYTHRLNLRVLRHRL